MRSATLLTGLSIGTIAVLALLSDVAVCPVAGLFAVPCPSCGLIRATLSLLAGDWRRAWELHPGIFAVLGSLSLVAGHRVLASPASNQRLMTWLGAALVVLLTMLWLARFFGHFGGPVPVNPWRFWPRYD